MDNSREYLKGLNHDELFELYGKYNNLTHNSSRYNVILGLYCYDMSKSIENEINRREASLDNSKKKIKKRYKDAS